MKNLLFIYPLAMVMLTLGSLATSSNEVMQTPVFISGEGGYNTYRIPAVITTQKGTLLAFCEGRRTGSSDSGNIDLLMKRSTDGGETWGEQVVLWDDDGNTCGNPCPVVDEQTGTVWLLLTHNLGEDHESEIIAGTSKGTRTVWVTSSRDDGLTWDAPKEITSTTKKPNWTWYATGPGIGIQLKKGKHKGRLVVPCDHKSGGDEIGYYSHCIYSDDGGKTWQLGNPTPDGVNECQLIERQDGSLLLNMRRSRHNKTTQRVIAISQDGGVTWPALKDDPMLIAPRCQASLVRYASSDLTSSQVLFSNPASKDKRIKMTVRLSEDDGNTWIRSLLLHEGPSAYSCLTVLNNGTIGCLYEAGKKNPYETITFARFALKAIK